jgi:hypothetical protein
MEISQEELLRTETPVSSPNDDPYEDKNWSPDLDAMALDMDELAQHVNKTDHKARTGRRKNLNELPAMDAYQIVRTAEEEAVCTLKQVCDVPMNHSD